MIFALYKLWLIQQVPHADRELVGEVQADLSLEGVEMTQGKEGEVEWRLQAKEGRYGKDSQVVELEEPRVTYFGKDQREKIKISGPRGRVKQAQDTAFIFPSVRVETEDGVVTAENATYIGRESKVVLWGDVRFKGGDSRFNSSRAKYYLDRDFLRAEGGVSAVIHER